VGMIALECILSMNAGMHVTILLIVTIVTVRLISLGVLVYVAGWYLKAAQFIKATNIRVAFVSTNSIAQGEQTGILWNELVNNYGIKIYFAHRTFKWSSEGRGTAAVHVVIIGFSNQELKHKLIFYYETPSAEAQEIKVKNINPYLVNAPDLFILKRNSPLCNVPDMSKGSQPTDGGNLLLTDEEKIEFLKNEPKAINFIRPFLSAREYLHNVRRWCLWLLDIKPEELRQMPFILERINKVKGMRLESKKGATRKWAQYPTLFTENRQPQDKYILVPRHSSENRLYIPFGFFDTSYIAADSCSTIPGATSYHFGILSSAMHVSWVKYVCGRLESRFRYSNKIVYNNYPWPKDPSDKNVKKVEEKAQAVLDVRAEFPESSLADLYDPLTMPPKLVKAHQALDKAVDLCYRPQPFPNEASRIEFLFDLYNQYTQPLISHKKKKKR